MRAERGEAKRGGVCDAKRRIKWAFTTGRKSAVTSP